MTKLPKQYLSLKMIKQKIININLTLQEIDWAIKRIDPINEKVELDLHPISKIINPQSH